MLSLISGTALGVGEQLPYISIMITYILFVFTSVFNETCSEKPNKND